MMSSSQNSLCTIRAQACYSNESLEHIKNNTPEAVIRELISNSYDAKAKKIYFGPLFGKDRSGESIHGFFFMDDGKGLAVESIEDPDYEVEEGVGAWRAFLYKGMSTKDDETSIGHKGQGTKLLLNCDKMLMVISRSDGDEHWGCWFQENPLEQMLNCRNRDGPECHIETLEQEAVMQRVQENLRRILLAGKQASINRERVHKVGDNVERILSQKSGTIIISLGIKDNELKEQLDGLDSYSYPAKTSTRQVSKPDHLIHIKEEAYLYWFIRFKTVIGNPFYREALEKGGFKLTDNLKEVQIPQMYLLTRADEKENLAPSNHVIDSGFYYCPLRESPERSGHRERKNKKNDNPLTLKSWRDGVFQDRFLGSFEVTEGGDTKQYDVALAIDGAKGMRDHFEMLGRRGGNKTNQGRSGINLSEFQGVLLYSRGTYVCYYNDIFANNYWENSVYRFLGASGEKRKPSQCYQLIINGDFEVQANRNGVTTTAKTELNGKLFLDRLKSILDSFKRRNGKNHFKSLLENLSRQSTIEQSIARQATWEEKVEGYKHRSRFEVQIRGEKRQRFIFFEPKSGMESTVINIYSQLCQSFPQRFFEEAGIEDLEMFWPILIDVFAGEGTDAVGVPQGCDLSHLLKHQNQVIGGEDFLNIEFKLNFRVPIDSDGLKFNHDFTLTDFIIAWDFTVPGGNNTDGSITGMEAGEMVYDTCGNTGIVSYTLDHFRKGKVDVPESMKDFCFFITDIKDLHNNQARMPDERKSRSGIIVFSLKQLIQATFDHGNNCNERSTFRWLTAEPENTGKGKRKKQNITSPPGNCKRRKRG